MSTRHFKSVVPHSPDAASQRLSLGQMFGQLVAAGAELKGLLHLLEHLLVAVEGDSTELSLNGRPAKTQSCSRSEACSRPLKVKSLPVFPIILHLQLVQDHLGEPGNIRVQGEKAGPVGKDAVSPWSERLWERWDV